MARPYIEVLADLKKNVTKFYSSAKGERFAKRIEALEHLYQSFEVPENHAETFNNLSKRGIELLKPGNLKDEAKLRYFLRYSGAAYYDFTNIRAPLTWIIRTFMVCTLFFYILTPQYFGFGLPLVMLFPVFVGLRGIQKRALNGLLTGGAIAPLSLMVGILHYKNIILAVEQGYGDFISYQASLYGVSYAFANNLMTIMNIGALIMMISALIFLYFALKHQRMFI